MRLQIFDLIIQTVTERPLKGEAYLSLGPFWLFSRHKGYYSKLLICIIMWEFLGRYQYSSMLCIYN